MVRLRNSSPFYLTGGIDFGDYDHRMRIAHAARRIAQRSIAVAGAKIGSPRAEIPPYVTPQAACDSSVERLTSQRGTPADQLRLGG
jgi:hypothetical protein